MEAKTWMKRGIELLLALALPITMTVVAAQSPVADEELPSAEGQLSEYFDSGITLAGYPTYPGENLPLYPGDEKWNGHYVMPAYAGPAPLMIEQSPQEQTAEIQPAGLLPYDTITVNALATNGTQIFAGLDRINSEGHYEAILARWGGDHWVKRAAVSDPSRWHSVDVVEAAGSRICIGGVFTEVNGVPAKNIACWNGSSWQALGKGVYNTASDWWTRKALRAIAIAPNGTLYAGGFFNRAGDRAVNNIARWDGSQWQDMGGGVNGTVHAVAIMGKDIYVGGYFLKAGGVSVQNIARWDGKGWHSVGTLPSNNGVTALAVYENRLYASVEINTGYIKIFYWDGTDWRTLGGDSNFLLGTINDILALDGEIFVSGHFYAPGDYNIAHIAYWDGTGWVRLGSGLNAMVYDLVSFEGQVYAGGEFTIAGNNNSTGFASWHPKPELVPYNYLDVVMSRGATTYLVGSYFAANQPAILLINGTVVDSSLVTDADGKIYIHLPTSPTAEPGVYLVELRAGGESALWQMRLDESVGNFQYPYDGYSVTLPADLPPMQDNFLPILRR